MKLEKKHWIMLIAGAVVLYLVYRFFFKKQTESSYDPYLPIFGGGMLENNNYTAAMLDPYGIESGYQANWLTGGRPNFESGYSAAQLDPYGIESSYGKPGRGGMERLIAPLSTVRNPIKSTDVIRPCGGSTVQGHYRCCKSGTGFVGYSIYPSCENLVGELPKEG
jgi:hypothetical protein